MAARGQAVVEQILARIRGSPVVHADETGGREDGVNGSAWTSRPPTARCFVRGRRERAVLAAALGDAGGGRLVSDFSGAAPPL